MHKKHTLVSYSVLKIFVCLRCVHVSHCEYVQTCMCVCMCGGQNRLLGIHMSLLL